MAFRLRPVTLLPVLFIWIWAVLSAIAQNMTLPGCLSRCGNVSIPYPFGIGKGCYRDKAFEILCKTREANSTNSSSTSMNMAPFLGVTGREIIELSLELLRIRGAFTSNCYDGKSGKVQGSMLDGEGISNSAMDLSASPFTFSDSHNKLFTVGCNVLSYISDRTTYRGCSSLCANNSGVDLLLNGSCFGNGCCENTI